MLSSGRNYQDFYYFPSPTSPGRVNQCEWTLECNQEEDGGRLKSYSIKMQITVNYFVLTLCWLSPLRPHLIKRDGLCACKKGQCLDFVCLKRFEDSFHGISLTSRSLTPHPLPIFGICDSRPHPLSIVNYLACMEWRRNFLKVLLLAFGCLADI